MSLLDRTLDAIREVKANPNGSGIDYSCEEQVARLPKVKYAAVVHQHIEPGQARCSHCGSGNCTNWIRETWCRDCQKSTPVARSTMSYREKHLDDGSIILKNMWW